MNIYMNNEKVIAGTTMKNIEVPEQNNMALHICENTAAVINNREQLAKMIGCEVQDFVCAEQTHSKNFYKVTSNDRGKGAFTMDNAIANTDALYTYERGILLTSFSADCVPVLLYNEKSGVIAAIHSGWQGTVKEVTPQLLHQLIEIEQNPAEGFWVYIGTALSQQKFEVDRDVYEQFKALGYADEFIYYHAKTNKYHIDNQQTVKKQCELAGIPANQIAIDDTCTFLHEKGFSYRQDKKSGRHMSFIMKK
ncbi:peptidoglycan editing factor PgeF [Lysinibacillus sp. KU-BSD001]|uniref:peptidoglycan editing factor PgeF n=1 Tax=Lysinibacillus sp. KU-BSD001 TaxID=3141328 RepID=UPI0036E69E06